jgi:hypothetical protein
LYDALGHGGQAVLQRQALRQAAEQGKRRHPQVRGQQLLCRALPQLTLEQEATERTEKSSRT